MTAKHALQQEFTDSEEIESSTPSDRFFPEGEDLVHLYFREIGRTRLLTPDQEIQIGRRIETGQIEQRRALAAIPMAIGSLLDIGDKLRSKEVAGEEVIVLPEGGDVGAPIIEDRDGGVPPGEIDPQISGD